MKKSTGTKKDAYYIGITSLLFIGSCIFFKVSLVWGFIGSILMTIAVLTKRGFSLYALKDMMLEGIKECKSIYVLILLIGATISIWMSSGTVPAMIYYGFQYMEGMNFLFSAFLFTSVMAIFIGTAVGTISTIGIAILGMGRGFGIPEGVLLGVIISGAYLADKISPISGLLNLTLSTMETTYRDTLRTMMKTLMPVYFLTAGIYYFIGGRYSITADIDSLELYKATILQEFYISPLLLLLPIGVLCLSIVGIKMLSTITLGLVSGIFISFGLQKMSILDLAYAIVFGYKGNTASAELNSILHSGGMVSMLEVVLIVAGAIGLSSILEKSGLIHLVINKTISSTKTKGQLIFKTGIISSVLTIVTCDQAAGVIIPGKLFKEKYHQLGLDNKVLARTISDTGTIIAPIIPWNINALIISMITGVSAISYIPYAVLCYIFPIITVIVGRGLREGKQAGVEPNW
ncbi:transporter, NhaC family (TC 2.A.35) [Natronincola peptidivorans]|uniref:Transporter, NhaC family (TC 2.A.35) n=1 Tax=Natronincola peptidivorans TaxID=426128 RepID=A0A1I0CAD9_9FIRM|nr:Na+/H+ antiporter NhaC family protein [Natronincola peptidivorans]SET16469.1 transporter, NhaC family (TC 2.A.35) [Natronincola peptidivorans]